ncbi:MAG: hypothetical protein ABWY05_03900 [Noviherbaspirillum sp.]
MAVQHGKGLPREIEERVLHLSRMDNLDYMDELMAIIETGLRIREARAGLPSRAIEERQAPERSAEEFTRFIFSMPHAGKDSDFDRHAGEFPDYDADVANQPRREPTR